MWCCSIVNYGTDFVDTSAYPKIIGEDELA
jgi:hypothetical protein